MTNRKDLLIFSNGPGEVSTWVKPFVEAVKARTDLAAAYRVILLMLPCQFGSGTEYRVGRTIEGIEHVIQKPKFMRMLITGLGKRMYNLSREGIICSLGGNLMYPVLFRRRIKGNHRLFAYSHNPGWEKAYTKIFVRNSYVREKYLRRGVAEEKLLVTGDLVFSSLKFLRERSEVRSELGIGKREKMVVFLPGSREYMTRHLIPIFLKLIDDVCERVSGIRPFLLKSPYVSLELIAKSLIVKEEIKGLQAATGTLHSKDGLIYIELSSGKRVYILEGQLDYWGRGIDFAVTIPGTNTVQLAYRKIPSLVVAPGNKPEAVPIEGAANFVKYIPFIGKYLLQKVILAYADSFPHTALPNLYMNEEILPEMVGILKTDDITAKIQELLKDEKLEAMREKLSCFQIDTNPVDTILHTIWGSPVH